jgi:hypothetical protein
MIVKVLDPGRIRRNDLEGLAPNRNDLEGLGARNEHRGLASCAVHGH